MTEWSQDMEKRILRKYRFTLTFRVLRILLICAVIYGLYLIGVSIIFQKTQPDLKHLYNSLIVLEWQQPNIKGQFNSRLLTEITPLLTQKINYPLVKQVGKEDVVVGEMHIEKSIWNTASTMRMDLASAEAFERFSFNLPVDPQTGKATSSQLNHNVWKTLEKIPEGTVAELAFSTSIFMEPVELVRKLAPYDINIVWMPLYMGELKSFDPAFHSRGSGTITIYDTFGLSAGLEVSDDYSHIWIGENFTNIKKSQHIMLENMEKLLNNEKQSYIEDFLGVAHLQERYDYLKTNGFQVYGAVVTGPTKELLKLKDIEGISNEVLGAVELWNWDNR